MFLLSPANLKGKRGQMLLNPRAEFALARELRTPAGAPLGALFSFVSGLYFRGKQAYAQAFGAAPAGLEAAFVMTAGGGLSPLAELTSVQRLQHWVNAEIHEGNPHFTAPLVRHASELLNTRGSSTRFILLGSVASQKYVAPLLDVFGERLLYPAPFLGLGDMSRGSLLLGAVREQRELPYAAVASLER